MSGSSYQFTHAVTRKPGRSCTDGLRAQDMGTPDLEVFLRDHAAYVAVLKETGANVLELPALEAYPDAVFVEDTALCLREGAIMMRPGAPSRLGEVDAMRPALETLYSDVRAIAGPGHIEGGDILTTESEILVGLSARTDAEGVQELERLVADWGYSVRVFDTPPGVLHFKTDCALLDAETILATERLDRSGCFAGYKVIHTGEGEEACANVIRFNDVVIVPDGFPKTAEKLDKAGYDVRQIGNSEAAKLDGGMSCLSLRFSPVA